VYLKNSVEIPLVATNFAVHFTLRSFEDKLESATTTTTTTTSTSEDEERVRHATSP
jgi:hypothetical protein